MVSDPSLALGELYMSGELVPPECTVYDALDVFLHNLQSGEVHPMETGMRALRMLRRRADQFNPAPRARRNVAHHYDLDNRLYSLFLDADRQYSCAYFETPSETLEAAQVAKKRHIAAKLHLHYALTLRHWRERFAARRERIAAVYDERFCRMFEFYLAGSEVAFRRADHMVWQLELCTAVGTLPITPGYMLGGAPAGG